MAPCILFGKLPVAWTQWLILQRYLYQFSFGTTKTCTPRHSTQIASLVQTGSWVTSPTQALEVKQSFQAHSSLTNTYWLALMSSPILPIFGVVLCLSQMWLKKLHPFQFCLTLLLPGFSVTRASSVLLTTCGLVQTNIIVSRPLHCLETYTLIAEISQFLCSQSFHLIN